MVRKPWQPSLTLDTQVGNPHMIDHTVKAVGLTIASMLAVINLSILGMYIWMTMYIAYFE